MADYRNILIIKPGAIGDLLQMTPVIRALAERCPGARITVMVSSAGTASLFTHNPHVAGTIVFDRKGEHRSFSAFFSLWKRVRRERFDLIVNFQRSNLRAWLLVLAAVPCRVLVYHKAKGRIVHAVVNHLEAVAPLGIDPATESPLLEFYPGDEGARFADDLLGTNGTGTVVAPVIALNAGASNRIKCWSTERFAALGDRLASELGARVVLVGGGDERDLAEGILSVMHHEALDLVGRTSLRQLGAVLQRCDLLVSGDTGPLHMATAVGTPVVALFGAIDPRRTGPVGAEQVIVRHAELDCVPCMGKECMHLPVLECMDLITVDEVYAAVVHQLSQARSTHTACRTCPSSEIHGDERVSR